MLSELNLHKFITPLHTRQTISILQPKGQLVTQSAKDALEAFKRDQAIDDTAKTEIGHSVNEKLYGEPGTVGAVAIDQYGNIAAATSTGGTTGKMVGRVGDSPLIGSGTYADNKLGEMMERYARY